MLQFKVIQTGNQIETQSKAAAPIAVSLRDNPKYLQMSNDILNHDSLSCQLPILSPLLFAQLAAFRLLGWGLTVFVFLRQALITAVSQTLDLLAQIQSTLFEQLEIVRFAACLPRADDAPRLLVNDDLRLYRMSLFLPRIISSLFFFGRSITVSVASTTMISNRFSFPCKTFLPGNLKSGQRLKISSILRMIRQTVGSLKCHELAMWNCVRYSRQYSNVSKTWSSILKKVGLPGFFCVLLSSSRTNWQTWRKVSGLIPQRRLNFSGDRCLMFS